MSVCHILSPLGMGRGSGKKAQITMRDFHNFGLIFAGQCTVCLKRLKSTFFDIFSNGAARTNVPELASGVRKNFKKR